MKKILLVITLLLFSITLLSCGSEEKKSFTICISASDESAECVSMRKGLVKELTTFGLIEDQNVTYYYAHAEGDEDYAKQIVDEFSAKYNPDLFVAIGPISTKVTYENFKEKPIVFLGVPNADRLNYFDELGKPKANMTGVVDSLLIEEQLDYIAKNHSDVKRLGIIYNEKNELAKYEIEYLRFNATAFNIDIKTVSIRSLADINKAIDAILPTVDSIILVHDNMVDGAMKDVIDRVKESGKPVFGNTQSHKNAGADVATIRDYELVGRDGGRLVKELLVDKKKVKDVAVLLESFRVN